MKIVSVIYTSQGHYSVYNTPLFDSFKIISWLICLIDIKVAMIMTIMTLECHLNLSKAVF